jgi:hypothetical protein
MRVSAYLIGFVGIPLLTFVSYAPSQTVHGPIGAETATCTSITECASQLLAQRAAANHSSFFVYKDADSGFNHGFPSGIFTGGGIFPYQVNIDTACVDEPADTTIGCYPASDTTHFDASRGTVMRISFPFMNDDTHYAGLNIEDPQDWGVLSAAGACGVSASCNGYDLTGATALEFDVRSPGGIAHVQFGLSPCTQNTFMSLPASPTYTHVKIPLDGSTLSCKPDLSDLTIIFTVTAKGPSTAATILLDNIQFTPAPDRQKSDSEANSVPLSNQTFGVVPLLPTVASDQNVFPWDQVNRNVATIYESSITILALIKVGDLSDAQSIADAFDYALHHDNHGDPLPLGPGGSVGLHNAYEAGDIGLLNGQLGQTGSPQAGDVRLAGFSCNEQSPTGYCLDLDGATGGNNAWAMTALLAMYEAAGNVTYLNDAITIGNWISGNLADTTGTSYGGYYNGYPDEGVPPPKPLNLGKSTENNADIYAAFAFLSQIESGLGNASATSQWINRANIAGDFVMQMFDEANGRFFAGTINPVITGPGLCPDTSTAKPNGDVINKCDFVDSNSFTALAMAGSKRYSGEIDWHRPLLYVLGLSGPDSFTQQVTAAASPFSGFDLVPAPPDTGIAWEFTGQMSEACDYVNLLSASAGLQNCAQDYLEDVLAAQVKAPFGDGLGLTAATLPNGDLTPLSYIQTPFQNIAERVGLAASGWGIFAEQHFNPLTGGPATIAPVSGADQMTTYGSDFPNPLVVRVTDANGDPVVGVIVQFGGAGLQFPNGGNAMTGTNGEASSTPMAVAAGGLTATATADGVSTGASFTLNATKAQLTITAKSVSIPYGQPIPALTYSVSGFENGDTLSILKGSPSEATTAVQRSPVGDYSIIIAAGTLSASNYTLSFVNGMLTITPIALQFIPITPCRFADTRTTGSELIAWSTREFNPQGSCGISANAVAYSVNVTVVPNGPLGYLTIYPSSSNVLPCANPPYISLLNSDGRVKANAATVADGPDGGVCVYVTNPAHVILDIDGYFVPAGSSSAGLTFYPLTPCRVADTRNATGGLGGPFMSGGSSRDFPILSGSCNIPSTAKAYSFNVTAVPHMPLGYLSIWPTGQTQPVVSTLNSLTGTVTANAAIVEAGTGGDISIFVQDDSDVILDINGYFAPPGTGGLSLYAVTPCRVADTRNPSSPLGGPSIDGGSTRTFPIFSSNCNIPSTAQAYVVNATVVPSGRLGYLSLWPDGETQPVVSTLNAVDGAITSNMAIVPTTNGNINAFPEDPTDLFLDISSYFAP